MHDGMPYGRIQGQGQGHEPIQRSSIENLQSREVDRQSPTGLIFVIMHYSVRCGHIGLTPMPIVACLYFMFTTLYIQYFTVS